MKLTYRFTCFALTLVFVSFGISCLLGNSPENAVEQFYQYINAGEYSKAKELYNSEAKQIIEGQLMALGGGFNNWADKETKNGTVEKIKTINSQVRGEGATVDYAVVYKDGSSVSKTVSLTKEQGSWKIGLVH